MKLKQISICAALAFTTNAFAEEPLTLSEIIVTAQRLQPLPSLTNSGLDKNGLLRLRTNTSDTAKLLDGQPGVSVYRAGGVSSMPAIHGMADDRVRIKVDGMNLISACANHMNAPLSYIDPSNIGSVKVFAGITPVSVGGDSIGGTIQIDSAAPEFAQAGEGLLRKGQVGVFYRSNDQAQGGNLSATIADEKVSIRYTGSTVNAKTYKAGGDFKAGGMSPGVVGFPGVYLAGNEVGSSQYRSDNNALDFGLRHGNHLLELKLGLQHIPYQGFPNVRMDMLKNDSQQINLGYAGQYDWGGLQARIYNEHTQHYMNFLEAKKQSALGMPMTTDGKNTGMMVKADVILSERDIVRTGVEYQRYRLNDYWDPISTIPGMMAPNTFWNINNGQRDRLDVFAELESRWNPQWISQLGLRSDTVKMDSGTVQGYSTMMYGDPLLATSVPGAFNVANRQHTDNNIDITTLARYTPDEQKTFEFGFAQKTRSPNLYERFAWSTNNFMVMSMNSWFGDGNGYVGNLNLKPEVARTLSGSASWHDADASGFEAKVSPYYTHIQDYIDATLCTPGCGQPNAPGVPFFNSLQLVNQSARLYGADISGHMPLTNNVSYGSLTATGVLNYVKGKNLTTGDSLYQIMPLSTKLGIEQHWDSWTNKLEVVLVSAKTNVEAVRKEPKSGGYGLLNLYSSYEWKQMRFDAGVENLFNKFYNDPLGGKYIGQQPMHASAGMSVPGMGRSINAGMNVKF